MRNADLTDAAFHQAKIHDCDLSEAIVERTLFIGTKLYLARMRGIRGYSANFSSARLESCDLTKSELQESIFQRAVCTRTNFYLTDLTDADFRGAQLKGSDFSRAKLSRARFGGAVLSGADLRWADLKGARELTSEQLLQAITDDRTILPNGSRGPYLRNSRAERPVG